MKYSYYEIFYIVVKKKFYTSSQLELCIHCIRVSGDGTCIPVLLFKTPWGVSVCTKVENHWSRAMYINMNEYLKSNVKQNKEYVKWYTEYKITYIKFENYVLFMYV